MLSFDLKMSGLDRTHDFHKAARLASGVETADASSLRSADYSTSLKNGPSDKSYGLSRSRCAETASGLRQRPRDISQPQQDNQFYSIANEYDRHIATATTQLTKLRKLAKQQGIFKDNAREIEELTYEINQVVTSLNAKLPKLEETAKLAGSQNVHSKAHYVTIVDSLKSRLLDVTKDFKDVLQIRTESMKRQDDRKNLYSYTGATQYSNDTHFFSTHPHEANGLDLESGGRQSQSQTVHRGFVYSQSRKEAVENIQRAIGELAQIFQRVATIVTAQEQMVRRIDEDVDNSLHNVSEGQSLLLSYYSKVSSNRSLIVKIFGIIILFVIIFAIFLT